MWYSFQCIRIPNEIAGECANWFYNDAIHRSEYGYRIQKKMYDDWFFMEFLTERHRGMEVLNLKPNLVDHIDFLIGGTLTNPERQKECRAYYFEEQERIEQLKLKLWKRNH